MAAIRTHGSPLRSLSEVRIEWLVVGRAARLAPWWYGQVDQVVGHRVRYTHARVLEPEVAVAFVGKEDRVTQFPRLLRSSSYFRHSRFRLSQTNTVLAFVNDGEKTRDLWGIPP